MRAVVQRCDGASVVVAGRQVGGFDGPGLVVLVGVARDDAAESADRLADKVWQMRLFERDVYEARGLQPQADAARELSAADLDLPVLVISQFTLLGRTGKGRRPTWEDAAPGDVAEPVVARVVQRLRDSGATVSTGEFGADMRVTLTNDGPVTVIVDV